MPELSNLSNATDEEMLAFLDSQIGILDTERDQCTRNAKESLESQPSVCASCGILCFGRAPRHLLPLSDPLLTIFRWLPTDGPCPQGSVVDGKLVFDSSGISLLLYPEGVDFGTLCATICDDCHGQMQSCKRPDHSMIAGICYGRLENLPNLGFVERMAITRVRLFTTSMQLVPKHKTFLRGTCISFAHEAAGTMATSLPLSADEVKSRMNVMFVGTHDDWANRKRDILAKFYPHLYRAFSVRTPVVCQWLAFLKCHHVEMSALTLDESKLSSLDNVMVDVLDDVHVCEDDDISKLDLEATSDIAKNRDPSHGKDHSGPPATQGASTIEHVLVTGDNTDASDTVLHRLAATLNQEPLRVEIPREAQPMNEFTDGGRLLSCAFPHLFLLGRGTFDGKLTLRHARYLMLFHDGRFARDTQFLYYVHDMLRRHKVIGKVRSMSLAGGEEEKSRIVKRFNSDDFKELLRCATDLSPATAAEQRTRDEASKTLLKELNPFLRTASAAGLTRDVSSSVLSQLHGLTHYYGSPSIFVTVAPADFRDINVMKLSLVADGHKSSELVIPLWSKSQGLQLATENPVFCAEVCYNLLHTILNELFRLGSANDRKKVDRPAPGIFGTMRAHYAILEAQARGTLHWHQLVWILLSPAILERCLASRVLQQRVNELVERFISTGVPREYLKEVQIPQAKGTRLAYECVDTGSDVLVAHTPIQLPSSTEFAHRVFSIVAESNSHKPMHHPTCASGTSGRHGCRMAMRKPVVPCAGPVALSYIDSEVYATPVDLRHYLPSPSISPFIRPDEVIVWEQAREEHSVYISPYNKDIANVSACNTNADFFGAPPQARAGILYTAQYMDKNRNAIAASLAALTEAIRHTAKYDSVASDAGTTRRKWCQTVQRWMNTFNSRHEVSAQQAAATCLGHEPFVSSERFWYCFTSAASEFISTVFPEEMDSNPAYTGALHGTLNSIIELQDVIDRSLDFPDDTDTSATFHIIAHDRSNQIVAISQHHHYFYSPLSVRHVVSLYEFSGMFDVIKMSDDNELIESIKSGRKTNLRINFHPDHSLALTHCLKLRSKHSIPNMSGKVYFHPGSMPERDSKKYNTWLAKLNRWARFCHLNFLPWDNTLQRRLGNPVHELDSWIIRVSSDHDKGRLQVMKNTTLLMRCSQLERTLCTSFRMRAADQWVDYGDHAPRPPVTCRKSSNRVDEGLEFIQALVSGDIQTASKTTQKLRHSLSSVFGATPLPLHLARPKCDVRSEDDVSIWMRTVTDTLNGGASSSPFSSSASVPAPFKVEPLDTNQMTIYNAFRDWICGVTRIPPMYCVLGAPGTGKSEIAKTLLNDYQDQLVSTAYQGVSASILSGTTLCSTFHIGSFGSKANSLHRLLSVSDTLWKLEKSMWMSVRVLIIDEVSQVTASLLKLVSDRLKLLTGNNAHFGGIAVLLMGDFFQLPPVFGQPLYAARGSLLDIFKCVHLMDQKRSFCSIHTSNLAKSRDIVHERPFSRVDWTAYGFLTNHDVTRGDFVDAIHICSTNEERAVLNRILAEQYACRHGRLLLRWELKLPSWSSTFSSFDLLSATCEMEQLYGLFVEGARAFLTYNFCTKLKICNGTTCNMVSVGYYDSDTHAEYHDIIRSATTLVVNIPRPDYIVVRLENGKEFPVPICDEEEIKIGRSKVKAKVHAVDIGFAITFHKVQGQTLPFVVLHMGQTAALRAASIQVGMSRVRYARCMKLFPLESLEHVFKKNWDRVLRDYFS